MGGRVRNAGARRRGFVAPVAGMLGTQVATAMALATVPVLAPEIARDAGLHPSLVGVFVGAVFAAAMVGSAACGALIARFGPVRANQLAALVCGVGVLLAAGSSIAALALSAVALGLGYGPNTPSSSEVLARVVPARRRGIAFSLKQSGAPAGAMLAGAVLPLAAELWGWQVGLVVSAVVCLAVTLAVQPLRSSVDGVADARASRAERVPILDSMRMVLRHGPLRRMTVSGLLLMVVHGCYQTFLVVYLVEAVGLGLAAAGGLYAGLQGAGAVSRVALGWLVDRMGDARSVLVAVSGLSVLTSLAVATFSPGWSILVMGLVCVLTGVGSSGWYGVYLAELTRLAPEREAGAATGGALFFVYFAIVAGPLVISGVVGITGSYAPAFVLVAMMAGVAAVGFLRTGGPHAAP